MKIVVYKGPLTNTIYAARLGKRGDTLEKWDVTKDVIDAVVQLMEKNCLELSRGKQKFELQLRKV